MVCSFLPLSPSQIVPVTSFFFLSEGWFRVNFDPKITPQSCFSFYPNWISDFTYFLFSFVCFCDFVVSERLCLFWFPVFVRCVFLFPVLVRYLFDSGWKISFEQVQIQSMTMTLASSTLQIRRHEYFGNLIIVILVIFVGIYTLTFYAINMDAVSLFTDSSFLFLANLNFYCIDVLYQFKWMNIVYFCKKIKLMVVV